jgi:predicted nucleotidyltransferase
MYTLNEIERKVGPIASAYGVGSLSVFGSYAQGTATSHSDIDFRIIDDGNLRGLIKLAGFCRELEDSLKVPVDVLTNDVLSPDFLERIKNEEIVVYE